MKKPISNPIQYVFLFLLVISFFQTCSVKRNLKTIGKSLDSLSVQLNDVRDANYVLQDSISQLPNFNETRNLIKIEGLKVEKRMIQSTNRNMMDLNRQSEIDKELESLE